MTQLNNIPAEGDDQRFKAEMVRVILSLQKRIDILERQANARSQ